MRAHKRDRQRTKTYKFGRHADAPLHRKMGLVKVNRMNQRLTPATAALLVIPPLLWAGNAVVGRMVNDLVPPITLNFLRWALAFFLLLPLAYPVLRRDSGMWSHWRRYALLGLLGVGCYNALQ